MLRDHFLPFLRNQHEFKSNDLDKIYDLYSRYYLKLLEKQKLAKRIDVIRNVFRVSNNDEKKRFIDEIASSYFNINNIEINNSKYRIIDLLNKKPLELFSVKRRE